MELEIEIETFDKKLDFDLFEAKERFGRGMETKNSRGRFGEI